MTISVLEWLEEWYFDHCDGDWEHVKGVEIGTLDNPGWRLRVDVDAEVPAFQRVEWEEGDEWLQAWLEAGVLNVACGPRSLQRALLLVRDTLATPSR